MPVVFAKAPYREHVDCKVRFSRSPLTFRAWFDILGTQDGAVTRNQMNNMSRGVAIGRLVAIRIWTWPPI
jgi:hypothetical protein